MFGRCPECGQSVVLVVTSDHRYWVLNLHGKTMGFGWCAGSGTVIR